MESGHKLIRDYESDCCDANKISDRKMIDIQLSEEIMRGIHGRFQNDGHQIKPLLKLILIKNILPALCIFNIKYKCVPIFCH